jgi:antibiotic biosynthesis monooxygenase (ABM) superfamily enzyme
MLAEHASQRLTILKALGKRHANLERLKRTAMVWLAAYPSVLLVISLIGDVLEDWPLPLRVLVATGIIVPIVANITEPTVKASFTAIERAWLRRRSRSAP